MKNVSKVQASPTDKKKSEQNQMYDVLKKRYHFSDEEMEYLKTNHNGLLFSLYGASKYSSVDANMLYAQAKEKLKLMGNTDYAQFHGKATQVGGRTVPAQKSGFNSKKWYSQEKLTGINPIASKIIGDTNIVECSDAGVLTDKDGRYWIGVGPNVMNPEHTGNEAIDATEMQYGTKVDIVLEDSNGNEKYLYCTVGETKAHTYPDGIHQTGKLFPNAAQNCPNNADDSVVEFCGNAPENIGGYKIKEVIVYENQ